MGELLTNGFCNRLVMQQRPRDPHFRRGYPTRKNLAPRGGASPPVLPTSTPPSMGSDASGNHSEQLSKTNLYIRGLTHNTTDKDLYSLCAPYGNIISTKAILDKQTNKCKGYGFVDFESPVSAEAAVKALANQGVQAQMAKVPSSPNHPFKLLKPPFKKNLYYNKTNHEGYGFVDFESPVSAEAAVKALANQGVQAQMAKVCYTRQQEQDPTNLYIANLPHYMGETELEEMLAPYGSVISTRILRDPGMNSRGVGFARMDNREMCEMIISRFNGKVLAGCKEALLVKFADGGNKRRNQFKSQEQRLWPERAEGIQLYDQSGLNQNGLASQVLSPLGGAGAFPRPYSNPVSPFQLQPNTTAWMHPPQQYILQQSIPPQMISSSLDPLHYGALMPQLTAHLSQLQLSGTSYVAGAPHAYTGTPSAPMYPQAAHIQVQPLPTLEDPMSANVPNNGGAMGFEVSSAIDCTSTRWTSLLYIKVMKD
ncbi:protein alan shepard [Trichonephila inaurata madagascariensis]|uniref:Protein alan shepard n=1 Tax=Trichonephila inaurata madagascariensis TaxID=2747483 RepID=A0A8X6K2D9_9ARAC|nr:protein alan shepard [Trichonephila inaurata madagascariensis]